MSALRILGWFLTALNAIAALTLLLGRDGGDAASRGIGRGLGTLLAFLTVLAATLVFWGGARGQGRMWALAVGCTIAAAPLVVLGLALSPRGLALIYPSLREKPRGAAPQYRFPDTVSREAAMALVSRDHARLDSILGATPGPDLTARDEQGQTLLGLAALIAVTEDASAADVETVQRLITLGARPRPDDLGENEPLLDRLASAQSDRASSVLALLLAAGLDANAPSADGSSVLLYPFLQPGAARLLLAHGADRSAREPDPARREWSAVTVAAERRHWATANVLLLGGVPPDHATPRGSLLAQVVRGIDPLLDAAERAAPDYRAVVAAGAADGR